MRELYPFWLGLKQAHVGVKFISALAILMVLPAEAAIVRSPVDFQQLFNQREGRDRSVSSSEKSSESVELYKPHLPSLIIEDAPVPVPEVEQQLIPDPLPPVFDEELALSAPRRLDVLKEAGAELPWPIGSYKAHLRGISIAGNHEYPHIDRRPHLSMPETPDKRHRYVHSILHGYGNEENVGGAFGV